MPKIHPIFKNDDPCLCPKSRTDGATPCGQSTKNDIFQEEIGEKDFCNICGHDVWCCHFHAKDKKQ